MTLRRHRLTRTRLLASLAAPLMLFSAACGSTAATTSAGSGGHAGSADGLTPAGGVTGGGLVGGGAAPGSLGNGSVAGTGSSTTAGAFAGTTGSGGSGSGGVGGGGGGTTGAAGTAGGSTGATAAKAGDVPGIEKGFIKIGMFRTKNAGAAYAAIGAEALAGSGKNEQMKQALVDEINNNGGIQGLKVRIVPYDIDQSDASTSGEVHAQRACTKWTQDDRVFAAVAGEGPILDACLKKAGVLEVYDFGAVSTYDAQAMNEFPLLFEPSGVLISRQVDFYVKGLVEAGYFTGQTQVPGPPKIGFMAFDSPVTQRQFKRLNAELKARTGQTFAKTGFFNGSGDQAAFSAALQNFMLQFKAAGINRIMLFDSAGTIAGFGMQAADKNQYFPRWGFNSTGGAGVYHGAGLIPESQLPGMTTVGWLPAADVGLQKGQGAVRPPGLDGCLAIMKKADLTFSSDTDLGLAGRFCDALLFFRDAMRAAPGISVNQFGAGAASLGDRFKSSLIYGTLWNGTRRDGGSIYRTVLYDKPCNCFKYVGGPKQM